MGTQRRLKRERAIARQRDTERFLRQRIALLEQSAYGTFIASGANHVRGSRPHGIGSTHNPRPLPPYTGAKPHSPLLPAPDMEATFRGAVIPDGMPQAFADVFSNAVPD
jgi:hypothetical protein